MSYDKYYIYGLAVLLTTLLLLPCQHYVMCIYVYWDECSYACQVLLNFAHYDVTFYYTKASSDISLGNYYKLMNEEQILQYF